MARTLIKRIPRSVYFFLGSVLLLLAISFGIVLAYYGKIVTQKMDGRRYSIPTRLYSDDWVLRPGDALSPDDVTRRLQRLRYAPIESGDVTAGRYLGSRTRITVGVNDRETAYGLFAGVKTQIDFAGRRVAAIKRADDGSELPYVVFEPEVVGTIFDEKMEDRTPVKLEQVPQVLIDAILCTEDRSFFTHSGLSWKRLAGAVVQALQKGAQIRGTSTLTQQLVKNMFLSPERKLKRKVIEGLMAIVLDAKYEKNEILEAYLNEIYLGQRGSISVTGVQEASRFYFGKSVSQLELPEAALLAGLISSPGKYSPFRNPENAVGRRTVVLKGMLELGKIDAAAYKAAVEAPLTKVQKPATGIVAPHFVDFVL
jgi:penicillin-binding protein 1B